MKYSDCPTVEVDTHVDAPPARVWELVSDLSVPAKFSDELVSADWVEGDKPGAGARFVGRNHHPAAGEWQTTCTVVVWDPPRVFEWLVADPDEPSAAWRFELEPDRAGTRLSYWARMGPGPSGLTPVIKANPDIEDRIVAHRLREWKQNMEATIKGIKALAEGDEAPGDPA